jgi:hydroxymethylpyrimidine/phosphomethylpyrimidine kinase
MTTPIALTIAGSDSGGGAGIQADLKTFSALGVYGASAITALTAQNTREVRAIFDVDPEFIAAQIDTLFDDLAIDAIKIGMLSRPEVIEVVARRLAARGARNLVLDPVMVAKSGDRLLRDEAVAALREILLPMAAVVTPNLPEAAVLLGREGLEDEADMAATARGILDLGAKAVLLKLRLLYRRTSGAPVLGAADRHEEHPRYRLYLVLGNRREPGARPSAYRGDRCGQGLCEPGHRGR